MAIRRRMFASRKWPSAILHPSQAPARAGKIPAQKKRVPRKKPALKVVDLSRNDRKSARKFIEYVLKEH